MPILPLEPDIYPDDLLEPPSSCHNGARWWAIYTLARREKELMRRLRAKQVAHYAPLIKRRTRSPKGRRLESYVPLFTGYVFMRGAESDRQEAIKTNCVARCLEVTDGETLERDLRQIQQLIATNVPLHPESRFTPGTRVRIRSGSMAGLEGNVVQRRGKDWLVVAVEFLNQGASVMLEDFQFERI